MVESTATRIPARTRVERLAHAGDDSTRNSDDGSSLLHPSERGSAKQSRAASSSTIATNRAQNSNAALEHPWADGHIAAPVRHRECTSREDQVFSLEKWQKCRVQCRTERTLISSFVELGRRTVSMAALSRCYRQGWGGWSLEKRFLQMAARKTRQLCRMQDG